MPVISIQNLHKRFGDVIAVQDANFVIEESEFVSILGPSGSGKSTILRMIAGFESPTSGSIQILGDDVLETAPFERDVNMVFQNLALFPHLTVAENIGYGLKQKGVSKGKRRDRTAEMLDMVDLAGYEDREIDQLSGGEQQRVALARAIVNKPSVVLFDEPLASLDRKLRQHMQFELQRIQEETEITFLYVTHDQEVAMSVSDRMIVLNEGRVEQIGSAEEIYTNPASEFVAQFIGDLNSITTQITSVEEEGIEVRVNGTSTWIRSDDIPATVAQAKTVNIGVRPQQVRLRQGSPPKDSTSFAINGVVRNWMYRGDNVAYIVETDCEEFFVIDQGETSDRYEIEDKVYMNWKADDCFLFDADEPAIEREA